MGQMGETFERVSFYVITARRGKGNGTCVDGGENPNQTIEL